MTDRVTYELDTFEQRLLDELRTVVEEQASAARPARAVRVPRRRQLLWSVPLVGAAAAAVAVAVVLRPVPAYAVSGGNGKAVEVKVNRLEGAEALQRVLLERGIAADITYLPSGKACQPDRYDDDSPSGLSLSVWVDKFKVKIPAGAVGAGETFVLSASVTPGTNGFAASVDFGVAQGAVTPCVVVNAR